MDFLAIHLKEGTPPVMHVGGEIDIATADQLRTALDEAVAADPRVVVDMADVTFIDASGLHVILDMAASRNGNGPLKVINAARLVRLLNLLELTELPSLDVREAE
jgi:anti-sigma B factor antagonist